MNETHLPPLPPIGTYGTEVCATVKIYLAIWSDLTPEQQDTILHHVRICPPCAEEEHILQQATHAISHLEASSPSERVNRAIIAAIEAKSRAQQKQKGRVLPLRPYRQKQGYAPLRFGLASVVVAATFLLVALVALHFVKTPSNGQQAFILPAALTWTSYVLYQTETRTNQKGDTYHVIGYYDPQHQRINVETKMLDGSLDVIMVGNEQAHEALGLDMMHHVAQWNADQWSIDESMFSLNALREELRTQQATYWGTTQFQGQTVYAIHCNNGLVILLDMHYMPVNILSGATKPGTGQPIYDTLKWMQPTAVSPTLWNMSVPLGFTMGTLPAKP